MLIKNRQRAWLGIDGWGAAYSHCITGRKSIWHVQAIMGLTSSLYFMLWYTWAGCQFGSICHQVWCSLVSGIICVPGRCIATVLKISCGNKHHVDIIPEHINDTVQKNCYRNWLQLLGKGLMTISVVIALIGYALVIISRYGKKFWIDWVIYRKVLPKNAVWIIYKKILMLWKIGWLFYSQW